MADNIGLDGFRRLVDGAPPAIAAYKRDLRELYTYVGLAQGNAYSSYAASDALYERIRGAVTSGGPGIVKHLDRLNRQLLQEWKLDGAALMPYIEVIGRLRDAIQSGKLPGEDAAIDWPRAVAAARDHIELTGFWGIVEALDRRFSRELAVATAAKVLRDRGYPLHRQLDQITLAEEADARFGVDFQKRIASIGGLNIARRMFKELARAYSAKQERYHLGARPSMSGGGQPQMPWGWLLQLAVKHVRGAKPFKDTDQAWRELLGLMTAYAALSDVQPYYPPIFAGGDAMAMVRFLQQTALYDSMFRIPQLRPSDVDRLARGMLSFLNFDEVTEGGWTLNQALMVIGHLLGSTEAIRGPAIFRLRDLYKALPEVPKPVIQTLVHSVLSHPQAGANQRYTWPTDAPVKGDPKSGITFFDRPLLLAGDGYLLVDRSVCSAPCIEALLSALRRPKNELDGKVGIATERFLEALFGDHGMDVHAGDYDFGKEHAEVDLAVDTPDVLVFLELKKKPLTRIARTGSDAQLLVDLAGSIFSALAQTGWHELRIRSAGQLALKRDGKPEDSLQLRGRSVERVALSGLDFGSFQDRVILDRLLLSTMNANFKPADPALGQHFREVNKSLAEIREQVRLSEGEPGSGDRAFYNCWFLSIPQMLIILDNVAGPEDFRNSLWRCRHTSMGTGDFYFEFEHLKTILPAPSPTVAEQS